MHHPKPLVVCCREGLVDADLSIYSTYRTNKRKENSSREHIDILLNHFGYNDINNNDKDRYEILLTRLYYTIYYKQLNDLLILQKELEKYIQENNYLKPIFVLFKMLCVINHDYNIGNVVHNYKEELKYLSGFINDYFIGELKLLNLLVLFFLDYNVDTNEMENLVYEHPQFSWFYNHMMGSHYYKNGNDIKAYMYYNESLRYYQTDENVERKLRTISNVSYTLNLENMFVASLDKTKNVIDYIYGQKNDKWIDYITQHYLYSLFMLKRYEDITSFLDVKVLDYNKLNNVSSIICLLATYYNNKLYKSKRLVEDKRDNKNLQIVYRFINGECDAEELDKIIDVPYLLRIKEVIKKNKFLK